MISFSLVPLLLALACRQSLQESPRPYPPPDRFLLSTNLLDHSSYLTDLDEPRWYLDNIPFVDFPDPMIQEIYYYRTSVLKRHLAYTDQTHG